MKDDSPSLWERIGRALSNAHATPEVYREVQATEDAEAVWLKAQHHRDQDEQLKIAQLNTVINSLTNATKTENARVVVDEKASGQGMYGSDASTANAARIAAQTELDNKINLDAAERLHQDELNKNKLKFMKKAAKAKEKMKGNGRP